MIAAAAADDAEWCRASGARQVFDYTDPDRLAKLGDAVPHGADVYWDTSGHQDLKAIAPLLALGARITVTTAHDPIIAFPARNYYTHDISMRPFAISNVAASDLATAARIINSRLADSTLRARIGARMPLTAAAEAHRRQEAGDTSGRIIVLP